MTFYVGVMLGYLDLGVNPFSRGHKGFLHNLRESPLVSPYGVRCRPFLRRMEYRRRRFCIEEEGVFRAAPPIPYLKFGEISLKRANLLKLDKFLQNTMKFNYKG
jgi:hypothetical protein